MEQVTIGRVVHYVLTEDPRQPEGQHRAALVVGGDVVQGDVNLRVALDLERDGLRLDADSSGFLELRRVPFGDQPGRWHWPERVVDPDPIAPAPPLTREDLRDLIVDVQDQITAAEHRMAVLVGDFFRSEDTSERDPAATPAASDDPGEPQVPQIPVDSMTVRKLEEVVGEASVEQLQTWLTEERARGDDTRATAVEALERAIRAKASQPATEPESQGGGDGQG